MAYKNSAGVKFNKDTELIITAAQDGTVESCYNLANNTEYVGSSFVIENAAVSVKNEYGSSTTIYYPLASTIADGYIRGGYGQLNAGGTANYSVLKEGTIQLNTNQSWEVVSGDAEIIADTSNRLIQIKGDCSLIIH